MSFYTVKQMTMRYPAFSESSFRSLIFNAKDNGFETCLIRPPGIRRVLIDENKFHAWLKSTDEGI